MSSDCSIDEVKKLLSSYDGGKISIDNYILSAASKAFSRLFKVDSLSVTRVGKDINFYQSSNKRSASTLQGQKVESSSSFAANAPQSLLTINQVEEVYDSYPITN